MNADQHARDEEHRGAMRSGHQQEADVAALRSGVAKPSVCDVVHSNHRDRRLSPSEDLGGAAHARGNVGWPGLRCADTGSGSGVAIRLGPKRWPLPRNAAAPSRRHRPKGRSNSWCNCREPFGDDSPITMQAENDPSQEGIMWLRFAANVGRVRPDPFVLSLLGVVLSATFVPCRGASADVFHVLGIAAIASLFFLQGARLSRDAILNGITHWRLHATISATTFVLFPLVGLGLSTVFPTMLPPLLWTGVLFVCALPSTVQSSIALTSIAQGNVAGAICSATASNVVGIALTPLIFGILSRVRGGGMSWDGVGQVFSELLVPFIAGHLLRPWIGGWVENNRRVLSVTDRGSILLVVYAAFSAAVEHGVWHQLPPIVLLLLALIVAFVLATILLTIKFVSSAVGFGLQDQITAMFCGSQKSLVSGVPIASALFSGAAVGPILVPIMICYPVQIVVCAWLARRYAATSEGRLDVKMTLDRSEAGAIAGAIAKTLRRWLPITE